jgi:hypothetical protein
MQDVSIATVAAEDWPVEFHCHGIRDFDFSELDAMNLRALNTYLSFEQVACVPTIYLPHARLPRFVAFMHEYSTLVSGGELPHILGIAVEGPLLSSFGGTPSNGVWQPTRDEWHKLCLCGPLGLKYVVVSPDFAAPTSGLADKRDRRSFGLEWAITELLDHGVAPAMGHFLKSDPSASAACIAQVIALNTNHSSPVRLITDHLFNDMPLAFRHTWRGEFELARRRDELAAVMDVPWRLENLDQTVGAVPAALMRAASRAELTLCMNFDGEHVDLAYCRRALDLLGVDSLILMTDRTDARVLSGQQLHKIATSSLWYQDDERVAAGSTPIARQIANLRSLGLDDQAVRALTSINPRRALGLRSLSMRPSYVDPRRTER